MIIAVDFDGTLCETCYPQIGAANQPLIDVLLHRQHLGDKLILWTCRAGEYLIDAIEWCKHQGLFFDAVNDNLEEIKELYQNNSRKITADLYIDDRGIGPSEMQLLKAYI